LHIYKIDGNRLLVICVLHQRMDVKSHL
jgi:plasmid stabilization system protein ParE